jgi:alpha-L-fucosidase
MTTGHDLSVRTPAPTPGDSSWFTHDRFGMFVHWGLYSVAARHEWVMQREQIAPEEYQRRYFDRFDPDLYDPAVWVDAAADAGMRYLVVTTKHHEGFCLWDSPLTDYKAPASPAGRDLLRPLVDALRRRDLRVGFYYSLLDWHHPHFPIDLLHPLRNQPDAAELNLERDIQRYREYLHGQVRELLTEFGRIDVLWADFTYDMEAPTRERVEQREWLKNWVESLGVPVDSDLRGKGPADWHSASLLAMVRELQPEILVNDRLGLREGWDITTPEQAVPESWPLVGDEPALWETCQTFSGSWGYHRDEQTWKSVDQLVVMLVDTVSKGGNLLLNVGPTGRGEIDDRALDRLRGMGRWMAGHSSSIYGCTEAPASITTPRDSRLTYNPATNRLYLHLLHWPAQPLVWHGMKDRVRWARLLHDGSELQAPTDSLSALRRQSPNALVLDLPVHRPDVTLPVIELALHGAGGPAT